MLQETIVIDGKLVASQIKIKVKDEVSERKKNHKAKPGIAVILVGSNPASQIYVSNKEKSCNLVGFFSARYDLSYSTNTNELLELIAELNLKPKIHGILVQLPLPQHINTKKIINAIHPSKDVDGFHPINIGKLALNSNGLFPCTPQGVMELMKYYQINCVGKHAVIIGSSNIVGRPMALEMINARATVTICNSKTKNLCKITQTADILIIAIGKPKFISADYIKLGAVVIDVGINLDIDGKWVGDLDYSTFFNKAGYITPVPGGVGPMTIAMLLVNTLKACKELDS